MNIKSQSQINSEDKSELMNTLLELYGETASIATDEEIHRGTEYNGVATPLTLSKWLQNYLDTTEEE